MIDVNKYLHKHFKLPNNILSKSKIFFGTVDWTVDNAGETDRKRIQNAAIGNKTERPQTFAST